MNCFYTTASVLKQSRWRAVVAVVAVMGLIAASRTALLGRDDAADRDIVRTVMVDSLQRRYRIHFPAGHDRSRLTPVVIAFHGGGGTPEAMIRLSGLSTKADEAGFIVVYPHGTGRFENQLLTFNGGNCCGYAMEHKVDDVAFVRALLDDLATVANVDPDRVFATGLSNGAIMSHYLASELSDRIAAIAPVAGPLMLDAPRASRPVPVMHFHGTADEYAPFQGGFGKGFGGRKGVTNFRSVNDTIVAWVKANRCLSEPITEALPDTTKDGMTCIRKTWSAGPDRGGEVVLIEITGGGHTWPGRDPNPRWLGASTSDISANDLMWEFFQKHPRRTSLESKQQ